MAKKRPTKPKNPSQEKPRTLPEDTVQLLLPPKLYARSQKLDAYELKHVMRAIFDHDSLYGVKTVEVLPAQARDDYEGRDLRPKKVCDGP